MTPTHTIINGRIYVASAKFTPCEADTELAELLGETIADAVAEGIEEWAAKLGHTPTQDEIQARADAIRATVLADTTFLRDSDPVFAEALALARDLILTKLSAQGLPAPRTLDTHAQALLDANPELLAQARRRVEARIEVGRAALAQVEAKAGISANGGTND